MFDLSSVGHFFIGEGFTACGKALSLNIETTAGLANIAGIAKEMSDTSFNWFDIVWMNIGILVEWY